MLGANGAIYAIRRSLFCGIPGNTIVDDFVIPLLARQRSGCRIVYDTEAVAVEETPARLKSEFHRRARIGAGGFQSLGLLFPLLNPLKGCISFTFASHKLLRWLCPFAMLAALGANVLLATHPAFMALLGAQAVFYLASLLASRLPSEPRILRYPRVATMFTMMNAALLVGFVRWLRSTQSAAWKRTERVVEAASSGARPALAATTDGR